MTEVTRRVGLAEFTHTTGARGDKWMPETLGAGGAFIDYDNDGWQDLLLVGGDTWMDSDADSVQSLYLFENTGTGSFREVTDEVGLSEIDAYGFGLAVSDYDNDGDEDFYLTTLHENLLFRNDGGQFTEVGDRAGVQGPDRWSTAAVFFDADGDGHSDLFVGNYVDWSPEKDRSCTVDGVHDAYCSPENHEGVPPLFYQNEGDGTFTERTEAAGFLPNPGSTLGAATLDVNGDGRLDLVVANDLRRNLLYINQGNGTFTEKGGLAGVAYGKFGDPRAGMGIDVGRVDSTGRPTVFVGNFSGEKIGVFRHEKGLLFEDRATTSRVGMASLRVLTFGLFLFDPDLDGHPDLFAANGHIQKEVDRVRNDFSYRQRPHLYLNDGTGAFDRAPTELSPILDTPLAGRGAAYADYDHDGDQDLFVVENGGPVRFIRVDAPKDRHFLRLRVRGTKSASDAVGTLIEAEVGDTTLIRRVTASSSYLSHSEQTVTLGLGSHPDVDTITIRWPSGAQSTFSDVSAGQQILAVEGRNDFQTEWRHDGETARPTAALVQDPSRRRRSSRPFSSLDSTGSSSPGYDR